jgi:hypothetical protein
VQQATTVWECYDLRTGKIYWDQTGINQIPTLISYGSSNPSVPGATAGETTSISLVYLASGRLVTYDPYTGAVTLNISIPVTTGTLYADPFVLSVQTLGTGATTTYRLINWTITGTSTNFTTRIMGNVSYPFSSIGTADYESMIAVNTASISSTATGVAIGQIVMGASLTTGQLLWNVTTDTTGLVTIFNSLSICADHGKFASRMSDGYIYCWDLHTGSIAWKTAMPSPWGEFGVYDVYSAYGLLYSNAYDGIRAINWTNGNIEWTFEAPAPPFETPYTNPNGSSVYSFSAPGYVADGKIYTFNCEHTPTEPLTRGWHLYCINATAGTQIWNITFMSLGQNGPGARGFQGAIADGYLAYINEYDGFMYVFGKGQSATTVSAPSTSITQGQSVVISGTVLDQSPAQPGTPCVSKDSMGEWMAYQQMQHAIPANVKGVPVLIDAVDPNGNSVHIATVTSDMSGTFGYTWTPDVPGQYKITATFVGDDSYGSSWAQTYASVVQAPAATPTATSTPITMPPFEIYFAVSTIAIIIAIVLVGFIFRKRP